MAAYTQEGSTPLPTVVVQATAAHTHTVIMLHGLSYDADMFEELPNAFGSRAVGIRFVYPLAPARTIHWPPPKGDEADVTAWYNYYTSDGGSLRHDEIEVDDLDAVTVALHAILDAEIAAVGGCAERVALGGNSQGGTVALHAALTHPLGGDLGVVAVGCCVVLDATPVPANWRRRVYVFSAERDVEYLPAFQRVTYGRLARAGAEITSHVEPGLDHYTCSVAEIDHTAAWICEEFFPGESVAGAPRRDCPDAKPALFTHILDAPLPPWFFHARRLGRTQPHRLRADELAHLPADWRPVFGVDP